MRTHYHNGEEITLQHNGCVGCNPAMVNGRLCHEQGCPDAWKDHIRECKECGAKFPPDLRIGSNNGFCSSHCYNMYWGHFCDCDNCLEFQAECEHEIASGTL